MDTATDLDHVLRTVAGPDLYRGNIFGITGVPVDASAPQIRRRREEAVLESRLNPDLDADAIRTAFELMRDPVARLTHELLWRWAPQEHRKAVEAEHEGTHHEDAWQAGLDAWAEIFENPESWAFARERVKRIDDPRLTTGTVRRLRERLPLHIASVTADLAVRAAARDLSAADRLVTVLDESELPDDAVDGALRDAIRPYERLISSACSKTRDVLQAAEHKAVDLAESLLGKVNEPMTVVEALLGRADEVAIALSDEIALVVNNCAIAEDRVTGNTAIAVRLLERAKAYARVRGTVDLVDENLRVISLADLTREMHALCDRGKVNSAARLRRALLTALPDGETKQALNSIPPNDKRVGGDVKALPPPVTLFGTGTRYYSLRRRDNAFQYTSTYYFTVLFIPLIPITAFLTSGGRVHAKIPLGPFARWWRFFVLTLGLGVLAAAVFAGDPSDDRVWIAGVLAVFLVIVAVRRFLLHKWAQRKVAGT